MKLEYFGDTLRLKIELDEFIYYTYQGWSNFPIFRKDKNGKSRKSGQFLSAHEIDNGVVSVFINDLELQYLDQYRQALQQFRKYMTLL